MKFAKHHKLLGNSNAENAEETQRTQHQTFLVFSALPQRSLRLCVEGKARRADQLIVVELLADAVEGYSIGVSAGGLADSLDGFEVGLAA
jgi:hypothetical protein